MNFKKILNIIIVIGVLAPALIFARVSVSSPQVEGICNKISDISSKLLQAMTERLTKYETKKTEIGNKIQQLWQGQDKKLAEKRAKWNENRTEQFVKLEEKAQDEVQKQAVIAFEQAVTAAIVARHAAIDTAISAFRQGVQQAKTSRQSSVDAAKTAFQNTIDAALKKAQTDCANGVNPTTVRQNLKNDLVAAKNKYKSDSETIDKISVTMDQLIANRKAAFEKAIQDFKTAIEKARADFKKAVGQENGEKSQKENACEDSGGKVITSTCCKSTDDFPNLCLIGACGCSPDNSHQVKICDCGSGKCFNGNRCTASQ